MNRDPNGMATALVTIITAVCTALGVSVDVDNAEVYAGIGAAVLNAGAVLRARRQTWAPDTVAALTPETVGPAGTLPVPPGS